MINLNKKGGWKRWKLIVLLLVISMSSFAFANITLYDEEGFFKNSFKVGEPVIIKTESENDYSLTIVGENKIYRFFGEKQEVVKFIPDEKGEYKIIISGADFNYEQDFSVVENFVVNYSDNETSELIVEIPLDNKEEILEEDLEVDLEVDIEQDLEQDSDLVVLEPENYVEDKTTSEDLLFIDVQEEAIQQEAVLGEPVKWTYTLSKEKLSERLNEIILVPESSENIIIKSKLMEDGIEDYFYELETDNTENRFVSNSIQENERMLEDKTELIQNRLEQAEAFQGKRAVILSKIKAQKFQQVDEDLIIEYYTPAPEVLEQEISTGKQVKISSPEGIHYENILAYSSIPEYFNLKDASIIKIWWVEENKFIEPSSVEDKDNNGVYDYVEWFVPHLSTQTFNIILITKANHLDEQKQFISDIYDEVKELDGIWSPSIGYGEYLRITFEKPLYNGNDITIFPKIVSGNPRIEVYEKDGDLLLAEFDSLNDKKYNKVIFNDLDDFQNSFDLKVVDGSVQFDHVIDPAPFYLKIQRNTSSLSSIDTNVAIDTSNPSKAFIIHTTRSANSAPSVLQTTAKFFNETLLTISRYSATAADTSWEIIESSLFDVQRNEAVYGTGDSSITINIDEVNLSEAFIIVNNRLNSRNQYNSGLWTGYFINSTAISLQRQITGTAGIVSWQVVEVEGANVQSNSLSSTAISATQSLSEEISLDNSFVIFSSASNSTGLTDWNVRAIFENNQTLNFTRQRASGTMYVDWFVIEHPFFSVQRGTTTVSLSAAVNQPISEINLSKTFSSVSWSSSGTGTTNANSRLTSELNNQTNLQFIKGTNRQTQTVEWQVIEINLDNQAPDVIINSPQETYYGTNNFPLIVNVTLSEESNNVLFTLDDGLTNYIMSSFDNINFNATINNLTGGDYVLKIYAQDLWGNLNHSQNVSFSVDTQGPYINIVDPKVQTYAVSNISLNYDVFDSGIGVDSCWWNLDDGANQSITCGVNTTFNVSDGVYTLNFYANDSFNNINNISVIFSVLTDSPVVVLKEPLDNYYLNDKNINFTYNITFSGEIDVCVIYGDWGGNWENKSSDSEIEINHINSFMVDLSSYEDSSYVWNIRCNSTSSVYTFAFTNFTINVDSTPPAMDYILGTPDDGAEEENNEINLNISLVEPNFANITFRLFDAGGLLNSSVFYTPITNITWEGLASNNITYYYNITAFDLANNHNTSQTRSIFLFDITPPQIIINQPENTIYDSNVSLDLDYSVNDLNLDSCWYNINNGANITLNECENTEFSVPEGENNLTLYSNDTLGLLNQETIFFTANNSFVLSTKYEVQSGFSTFNGSQNVSINKISRKNSFILLTSRSGSSFPSALQTIGYFSDSDTLTLENYFGDVVSVEYQIISGPEINVQRGRETYSNIENTITIPISSVNLSKAFIIVYNRLDSATKTTYIQGLWRGYFFNESEIRFERINSGSAGEISWQVIEWDRAEVQSGNVTISSSSVADGISEVNLSNSLLFFSHSSTNGGLINWNVRGSFTDNQTVSFLRGGTYGDIFLDYFVVEHPLFNTEFGQTSVSGGTEVYDTFTSVDLSRSFLVSSWDSTGGGDNNANSQLTSKLYSTNIIEFFKGTISQSQVVDWQVTEIIDFLSPELSILSPLEINYTESVVLLNISATDDVYLDSIWFNWNGTNTTYSGESYIEFSEGINTINVWANDTSGNMNYTNASFFIDSISPDVSIGINDSILELGTSINITWFVNDTNSIDAAMFYIYYPNGTVLYSASEFAGEIILNSLNLSVIGIYNISLWANDTFNNYNFIEQNFSVIDTPNPVIFLLSPFNNTGSFENNIFEYIVSDFSEIQNCSLILNGVINSSDSNIEKFSSQYFNLQLEVGEYNWSIECIDNFNNVGYSQNSTIHIFRASNFTGATTNLSNTTITNIVGLKLERPGYGSITFNEILDLSGGVDFDEIISLNNNFVSVDTLREVRLNVSANITMENLPNQFEPVIIRNQEFCDESCNILSYTDGNLTFVVPHFTNYSTTNNSALNIWDDTDNESGYQVKYANDQIMFYANYSNITSGLPIIGASCNISFLDYNASMNYNSTLQLFIFNRSFNDASTYNWSVYCDGSPQGFESLNLSDEVTLQSPGVLNVTLISPNVNVNVSQNKFFNFSANITCNNGVCRNITAALDPVNWWNSAWPYKIPFNLTVASGSTGTDFQFKLTLNSSTVGPGWNWSNECVNNNSRIRFVNGSENLELPYWVQNCSVTGQTMDVWIKTDTSITTSGTTVYLYYGNPTASLNSNGTATFDFFDDFSGDLSKWTRHKTSGVYPRIESGYLVSGGGIPSSPYGHTVLGSNATYTGFQNGIIEGTTQLTTNSIGEIGFRGIYDTAGYKSRIDARSGQGLSHLKPPYNGWYFLPGCTVSGSLPPINQWLPFSIIVSGTSFNISVASQTKTCTDSQYSSAGEISLQNHYGSYTLYDDIRVRKYFSLTPSISFGSEEVVGVKGIIPENSGTPFYTINPNPRYSPDLSCLNVLYEGESCSITWFVNATGNLNSYWNFFVTANYSTFNAILTGESKHINITIIDDTNPPSITNPQLNTSILNQTDFIRLNVSVTDESLLDFVIATILYPNSSSNNFSMSLLIGDYYYLDFNDTLADGVYNITHIIAKDQAGNMNDSTYYNLSFNITSSPPSAFNLTSPLNNSESSNLFPNLTWESVQSTKFSNYTILISSDINFNYVNFSYYNFNISNTSRVVDNPLNSNTIFYWRVIASNIFGAQTNSTQDFIYITDTLAPTLVLNYPGNNNYVTSSNVLLNYTSIETNTLTNCTLYGNFSGTWVANETNISVIKNQANTFNLNLADGSYLWNVLCYDAAGNSAYAVSNNTFKIDTNSPIINLMTPQNDTTELITNNIFFEANATDAMTNISSCSLIIDDVLRQTIYSVTNNLPFNFTEVVLNGNHTWNVNCTDTNGFEGSSIIYNISVNVIDTDPPLIDLNYPGESVHVSSNNLTFNFTPKDATGLENCSVYIDGVFNGSIFNPVSFVPSYYNISNLSETTHSWQVQCFDNSTSNNFGVSNIYNFTVDLTNPTVILNTPLNDSFIPLFTAYFNFTPNDTNLESCSLYGNFSGTFAINKTITNPLNNNQNNFSLNLSDGIYLWNVYCNDKSGRGSFASQNFTVKVDINSPRYFNISAYPATPANYSNGRIYSFNITWIDTLGVSSVLFENNFSGVVQNQSPVNIGNNIYGINLTNFSVGNYYYVWHANDTKNNINKTNQQIYVVQKGVPNLSLQFNGTESSITINQSQSLNITAKIIVPSSGYLELFKDGILINNGTSPLTNETYFYEPGYFNLTVVFLGDDSYVNYQKTYFVNVTDVTPPNIILNSPGNNSIVGTSLVNFQYIVYDSSLIQNCSLFINNVLNETNSSVITGITQTFTTNLSDGNYSWRVQCVDSYNNIGQSDTYNFTVFEISDLLVLVNLTKSIFQLGEIVPVNVLTTDIFDNPVQSTSMTAIIYTNTTNTNAVWWNSSWKYRLPIIITENNNSILSDYQLNISINTSNFISTGKMRSDCGDIRFADVNGLLIPHIIDYGCNTSSTIVWVKIDVNASQSKKIYLYYGNSNATHSNNASSVFDYYDSSDQISSWTINGDAGQSFAQGLPTPSYYAASINGYYMYKNIGLTTNKIVDFNVRSDGLGNFYFLVNSAGAGQHFRAETRGGNSAGISSANSWTSWAAPSACSNINTNTWYNFSLVIGPTTSQAYINGVACGGAYTFTNNGGYIGLIGDALGGSYTTWWDNIRVRKYVQIIPTFNISNNEEILVMTYVNQTDIINGTLNFTFDSFARNLGNYSVVTKAYTISNQIGYNSTSFDLTLDTTGPNITLHNPFVEQIVGGPGNFNVTFNWSSYDYSRNSTCNLTIDSVLNQSGIYVNSSSFANITVSGFTSGVHYWNITCVDVYANIGYSETRNFTMDLTSPQITLNYPVEGFNTSNKSIIFDWTATDDFSANMSCIVFIDGVNQTGNITSINNVSTNITLNNLNSGTHNWSVSCYDLVQNNNISEIRTYVLLGHPEDVYITLLPNQSALINWTRVLEADTYNIYISENYSAGFPPSPNITGITSTQYVDGDSNRTYRRFYRISSVRGVAETPGIYDVGTYSIQLYSGFNMISNPFLLKNYELKNDTNDGLVFNTNSDCLLSVWNYLPADDLFERTDWVSGSFYPASGSENFTKLNESNGYWLETNSSCILRFAGIVPNQNMTKSLYSSFNLVPWLSPDSRKLSVDFEEPMIVTIPENSVIAINRFNASNQQFEVTIHYLISGSPWGWWPSFNNQHFTSLVPMEGYYFDSSPSSVWYHKP